MRTNFPFVLVLELFNLIPGHVGATWVGSAAGVYGCFVGTSGNNIIGGGKTVSGQGGRSFGYGAGKTIVKGE